MKINPNLLSFGLMLGAAAVVLLGLPADAFAGGGQDLGGVTTNVTKGLKDMPTLINLTSYIGGAAFGVAGVLKLKQHVDNPGSVAMKDGVMRIGAAAALLALPVMTKTVQNTMFGSNTDESSAYHFQGDPSSGQ